MFRPSCGHHQVYIKDTETYEELHTYMGFPHKNWIQNLGIEAECAISLLPQEDQEYMRLRVAKQIGKIYYQRPSHHHVTPIQSRELRIAKSIKEKLIVNNATITKADKGNSIVTMYNTDYDDKVLNFIHNNNAHVTTNNTTATFQKELKLTLKGCKTIISPQISWKLTNLNPKTPNLKGLLKVHKTNMPIRPVVDYSPAPAYKIAKKLSNILKTYVPLTYAFNIRNSTHLIKDISEIPYTPGLQLASLDISDMYSNIPTNEVEHIIRLLCKQQDIDPSITEEILA